MSKLYDSNLKLNSNMIDPFYKQQLEKAYELLLNDNNLSEIENLIHDYLSGLVEKDKDRKSTRLNSSHSQQSRMPSSA